MAEFASETVVVTAVVMFITMMIIRRSVGTKGERGGYTLIKEDDHAVYICN